MNTLKLPGAQSMRYKVSVFFTPCSSKLVSSSKTVKDIVQPKKRGVKRGSSLRVHKKHR